MFKRVGFHFILAILLVTALQSSADDKIKVYSVPKEKPAALPSAAAHSHGGADPHASIPMAMPRVKWTKLPEGWKENPSAGPMRAASFLVSDNSGSEAELGVIPMGGMPDIESQLVNMWRGQLKLDPLSADELAKQGEDVSIADGKGKMFDLVSTEPVLGGKFKARILAAMIKQSDTSWFFKFTGEEALVAGQRKAMLEFMKGVSFEAAPQMPAGHPPVAGKSGPAGGAVPPMMGSGMQAPATEKAGTGERPTWQVPATWKEVDRSTFLVAKFRASGEGAATADINVSMSSGDAGGLLSNVNRWRGQLGLEPFSADALAKSVKTVEAGGVKISFVEMSGKDARTGQPTALVGAMTPRSGETWFYKLMGDSKVVTAEKDAFNKFVQGVKY